MLREVREDDLDTLFEQQREPEATAMALFPAREREAFDAHWRRVLADPTKTVRTIDCDGAVAGNIGSWEEDGRRLVGYWIGREFWGRGLATSALKELAAELDDVHPELRILDGAERLDHVFAGHRGQPSDQ